MEVLNNSEKQEAGVPIPYPVLPDEALMKVICESMVTDDEKWRISVLAGLIFLLVSSPLIYQLTGSLGDCLGMNLENSGCPTTLGLLVHTVVFVLITRLLMR